MARNQDKMQHKLTEIFKKAPLSSIAMPKTSHVTKLILMQNHYLIFGSYSIDIDMDMVHCSDLDGAEVVIDGVHVARRVATLLQLLIGHLQPPHAVLAHQVVGFLVLQ